MTPRIAIVEYSPIMLGYLQRMLEHEHKISPFKDPFKALSFFKKNKAPQLLILDLGIPGFNGIRYLQELRKIEKLESVPIIVLSGNGDPSYRSNCFKAGISDFITKPYKPQELKDRIQDQLSIPVANN